MGDSGKGGEVKGTVEQSPSGGAATRGEPHRSGFVALVGRPNAGKSTLLNALMGTKVSITTPKPQTTRNSIRAILTLEDRAQVVFVDTPGIHLWLAKKLNALMVAAALRAVGDADVAVLLVDAGAALDGAGAIPELEQHIIGELRGLGTPVVLVVNKLDVLESPERSLPIIDAYRQTAAFEEVIGVSALQVRNLQPLVDAVVSRLPEGPQLYPADLYTDQAERFIAAEIVREQIILQTGKEIPYSVAVEIERFEEDAAAEMLRLRALIHVERASQKGIVIGKGGSKLKSIGTKARAELERFFGRKVFLETFVRVQKEWTEDLRSLGRFGYTPER